MSTLVKTTSDGYFVSDILTRTTMPVSLKDIILQVKENLDIVQVIGQYIPLKKAGSRYLGLCPFHNDRSPSMHVTPQLNLYKCFACGAGGDVIHFVQEYEKIGFIDALRLLCDKASIVIPDNLGHTRDAGEKDKSTLALQANQLACQFYQDELAQNTEVHEYLRSRGITPVTAKHFQIGYAPQSVDKLLQKAAAKKIPVESFMDAGIIGQNSQGRYYDRFQGRLIFPIWNLSGHVIGFGGRLLGNGDFAKYMNSPESMFYHKSKVLYGFNFSRSVIAQNSEVILVEGYMDLLALWQAGIHHAVAVSGTALTTEHVQTLARFVKKAYLFFDGDAAGRKAVLRSIPLLLAAGVEVRIPALPSPEDPDSFVRKNGAEKTLALLQQSPNVVDFLTEPYALEGGTWSPEQKESLLQQAVEALQVIPSPLVKSEYYKQLSQKLGLNTLPVSVLQSASSITPEFPRISAPNRAHPEWQLLDLLLSSYETCLLAIDQLQLEWIADVFVRDLIDHLLAFVAEEKKLNLKDFLPSLSSEGQDAIATAEFVENSTWELLHKNYRDLMAALETRFIQKRMGEENDFAKKAALAKRLVDLNRNRNKGGNP